MQGRFDALCDWLEFGWGRWVFAFIFACLVIFGPPAVGAFVLILVGGFFVCGLIAMIVPPIGLACFAFWLYGLVYMLTHPLP